MNTSFISTSQKNGPFDARGENLNIRGGKKGHRNQFFPAGQRAAAIAEKTSGRDRTSSGGNDLGKNQEERGD